MSMRRWVDWVIVILGLWLIASPWFLSSDARAPLALWSVWSIGGALVALGGVSMIKPTVLADSVGVLLGVWLIATPWIVGRTSLSSAVTNAVLVGLLVIAYALWAFRIDAAGPSLLSPAQWGHQRS